MIVGWAVINDVGMVLRLGWRTYAPEARWVAPALVTFDTMGSDFDGACYSHKENAEAAAYANGGRVKWIGAEWMDEP